MGEGKVGYGRKGGCFEYDANREQVNLGAGPNGWMFWPDANGMSAAEVFWKEEVGLREHIFDRIGGLQAGLGDESEDAEDESSGLLGLSYVLHFEKTPAGRLLT